MSVGSDKRDLATMWVMNTHHDVPVVVFARPNEPSVRLDCLGDHVVDEAVFVVDSQILELLLVGAAEV